MNIKFRFVILFSTILLFFNCASHQTNQANEFGNYLASMVNVMTYDQAIMKWGQPTTLTEGDEVFVAAWGAENVGAAAMPIGKMVVAVPVRRGWELVLSFNKKTRRMINWRYDRW